MSLPHNKAPVADAIGAFSFVRLRWRRRGASNPLPPPDWAYAGAIRFSVSSIPSVIAPRMI